MELPHTRGDCAGGTTARDAAFAREVTRGRQESAPCPITSSPAPAAAVCSPAAFHDRDLYPFIYNLDGICVAHGARPALVGKNLIDLKDQDGKFLIREMVTTAKGRATAGSITNDRTRSPARSKTSRATSKRWRLLRRRRRLRAVTSPWKTPLPARNRRDSPRARRLAVRRLLQPVDPDQGGSSIGGAADRPFGARRQRLHDVVNIGRRHDGRTGAGSEGAGVQRAERRHCQHAHEDLALRVVGEQWRKRQSARSAVQAATSARRCNNSSSSGTSAGARPWILSTSARPTRRWRR